MEIWVTKSTLEIFVIKEMIWLAILSSIEDKFVVVVGEIEVFIGIVTGWERQKKNDRKWN